MRDEIRTILVSYVLQHHDGRQAWGHMTIKIMKPVDEAVFKEIVGTISEKYDTRSENVVIQSMIRLDTL